MNEKTKNPKSGTIMSQISGLGQMPLAEACQSQIRHAANKKKKKPMEKMVIEKNSFQLAFFFFIFSPFIFGFLFNLSKNYNF